MAADETNQSQPAGRILDARGRSVTQLDPVAMHLLRRPGIVPPDVLREIAQDVGIGLTKAHRVGLWASLAGLVCLAIALAILITRLANGSIDTARFARSLVPYIGVGVGPLGLWIGARNTRHERIGRVMLEHLRCPHCGYDIRGLPADPQDGATVCPECGCAWSLQPAPDTGGHEHG
jgi:hypothetical protein